MNNVMQKVQLGSIVWGDDESLPIIAGPCVIESRDLVFKTAEKLKGLTLLEFSGSGTITVKLSDIGKKLHGDFQAHGYFNK